MPPARRSRKPPAEKSATQLAEERKAALVQRGRQAARARADLTFRASRAMARDLKVILDFQSTGVRPLRGWVVSMTNDHKPLAGEHDGPSNLVVHLAEEDPAPARRRGELAAVIAAAASVPLEQVGNITLVDDDG